MDRRNTIQRTLVLNAVQSMHRHVTADEVFAYIREMHPSIGKATVYRNLKLLAEEGLIKLIEMPEGPDRYDFRITRHYHVRCIRCDRIFDVNMEREPDLNTLISDTQGIRFIDYDILFKGICPECQQREKEEE